MLMTDTHVSCSQSGVHFIFQDIVEVQVYSIDFIGCVSNVAFVEKFPLEQCKLEGNIFGSRLELNSATVYATLR